MMSTMKIMTRRTMGAMIEVFNVVDDVCGRGG